MPDPDELQNLLNAMAESEPRMPERSEFGTIAWVVDTR
jgi:hypothetical protein